MRLSGCKNRKGFLISNGNCPLFPISDKFKMIKQIINWEIFDFVPAMI